MPRYLDISTVVEPPKSKLHTHIRTSPRVKGILWNAGIGMEFSPSSLR